jgi:RimJ/RimL family protein N-acetyltransferase
MPRPVLGDGALQARAVEPGDIEAICAWRNAQMDVLRQSEAISPQAQAAYFRDHIWPDKASLKPANILLALERDGRLIGYGGLVHIAWDYGRAEVSFLLETSLADDRTLLAQTFPGWLRMMQSLAFSDLGLNRLTTETYAMRHDHIALLEAAGFQREGVLRDHVRVNGAVMDAILHARLASDPEPGS